MVARQQTGIARVAWWQEPVVASQALGFEHARHRRLQGRRQGGFDGMGCRLVVVHFEAEVSAAHADSAVGGVVAARRGGGSTSCGGSRGRRRQAWSLTQRWT